MLKKATCEMSTLGALGQTCAFTLEENRTINIIQGNET